MFGLIFPSSQPFNTALSSISACAARLLDDFGSINSLENLTIPDRGVTCRGRGSISRGRGIECRSRGIERRGQGIGCRGRAIECRSQRNACRGRGIERRSRGFGSNYLK